MIFDSIKKYKKKIKLSSLKMSIKRATLFSAILAILTVILVLITHNLNLTISFAFIGLIYTIFIVIIDKHLVTRGNEIWIVPLVYSLMTIYFALLIAKVLIEFSVNIGEINPGVPSEYLDYTYFTLITMLSVGYGDLSPEKSSDQIVAMIIAMFGSAHMLVSVALFFSKINNPNSLSKVTYNENSYNQSTNSLKITINQV